MRGPGRAVTGGVHWGVRSVCAGGVRARPRRGLHCRVSVGRGGSGWAPGRRKGGWAYSCRTRVVGIGVRAQLQHTCAAHPAEVQVWHGAPLLRAAGCFQCVSGVSTFLGILVRTRNCNGSQCADPRAHKETAMVRNQLTPKCNRSNRCSFTKPPGLGGFPV